MAKQPIYQFYSELAGYEPKTWRRFQVPRNITMAKLGYILMTMYEMEAIHLFNVTVSTPDDLQIRYEIIKEDDDVIPEDDDLTYDAATAILGRQFSKPGTELFMEYDYGDNWEISLTLEDVLHDEKLLGRELPRVLDGEGYGIIEDCGGPDELKRLAVVSRDKCGHDYEELLVWLERDELDLCAFNKDDMNYRLKKVPRIFRDRYEHGDEPSKRSLALLERKNGS